MNAKRALCLVLAHILVLTYCYLAYGEEQLTQGEFVIKLVKFLRLEYKLPKDATVKDYADLLKEEGFRLPENFSLEKEITKEEKADLMSQLINRDSLEEKKYTSKLEVYRNRAVIEKVEGNVFVKFSKEKEWVPAKPNMALTEGDYIKTEKNSSVHLKVGVAGNVIIKENTEFLLKELSTQADKRSERILMYLAYGEITVDARGLEPDSVLETYTPTATAAVRGTVYTVTVSPIDNKTEIREEL